MTRAQVEKSLKGHQENRKKTIDTLITFLNKPKVGELVPLKTGIRLLRCRCCKFQLSIPPRVGQVWSHWNRKHREMELPWNLSHTRRVLWYVLWKPEAIHHFRKGIYGGSARFCRVGSGSMKKNGPDPEVGIRARAALNDYLLSLGYDNLNGKQVLEKIGVRCRSVNEFGFPSP